MGACQVCCWVEGVCLYREGYQDVNGGKEWAETRFLPSLEWRAPTCGVCVVADPPSGTAVEVEEIGSGVDEFVPFLRDGSCVGGRDPDPVRYRDGGIDVYMENRGRVETYMTIVLFARVTL